MKKLLSILTILLTAGLSLTATAATYYKGQTLTAKTTEGVEMKFYVLDPDARTCAISSQCINTATAGKVTVPSYVEGFQVVEANGSAFYNCKSITSVVLPYTLKKMGNDVFWNCESLTEVSLPSNLEEMGSWTFENCKKLKSVTIPSKITNIPRYTFYKCSALTDVKLPARIDSVFYEAFQYCTALQTIALPSTVRYIDSYAFYGCTSLKTITGITNVEYIGSSAFYNTPWFDSLPNGMVYIGKVAYRYNGTIPANTTVSFKDGTTCISGNVCSGGSNLVAVTIPASVRSIGQSPFGSHSGLNSITVAAGNKVYDSRGGCNAIIETATNTLIAGSNTTIIPSTVKAVAYDAFYGSAITSVNIPDAVDSIASGAFNSCSKLKSVTIGKGLRTMNKTNPFCYSYNLKDIVVSAANPYYDSRNNCKGIVDKRTNTLVVGTMGTVIPSTVKAIGDDAFRTCNGGNFYTYTVPSQIEKIGRYAFAYNAYMRSVTIGRGVNKIDDYAFYGCSRLTAIHALMDTPCEIKENVFRLSSTYGTDSIYNHATLYVPVGSRVNYMSTPGWNKFKHIVETNETGMLDGDIFTAETVEGHLLTYQVLSNAKKTCELIGSPLDIAGRLTIPAKANGFSVLSIGANAFYGSGNERDLTAVSLPEGLVTIGEYALGYNENLVLGALPSTLETIGAWAFTYCKNTALHIPASVKNIGRSAFCGWDNLTTITVDAANTVYTAPAGSNAIVERATKTLVQGCPVTIIPADVECIGEYAFNSLQSLKSIDIPASVTSIGYHAFNNTGLTSITLQATVRSIDRFAFRYCDHLATIYSNNPTPFAITDDVFDWRAELEGPFKTATLYVPRGTKALYQATDGWRNFENIEESDFGIEMVTVSDVDYLVDASSLTATVKLIHANQTDVVIPETLSYDGKNYQVMAVGDSVFCSDTLSYIYSVTFPATITKVDQRAFWRYNPSAIVWNSDTKIPEGSFGSFYYRGTNFLLYVKKASVAPSGVENLIVNGQMAGELVLTDTWQFNCPQEFTAARVSFTHDYKQESGMGKSAGWETLSLPFDVMTVTHESKGRLVPFAVYQQGSDSKPFWLYALGDNGFVKASAIKANTPYIISMPNNDSYTSRYNVAGKVTFAATNATIRRTGADYLQASAHSGATFIPCYSFYLNDSGTYALNALGDGNYYTGSEDPGSVFVTGSNIIIYPFSARMKKVSAARTLDIVFADESDETTLMVHDRQSTDDTRLKVYSLSGQLVGTFSRDELYGSDRTLPAGIYVINGRKVQVK